MNPAIEYTKEMNKILPDDREISSLTDEEKNHWLELHEKCHKECSHTDENGKSSWRRVTDDLMYCLYCDWND